MNAAVVVLALAVVIPLYALAVHGAIRLVDPHNPRNVLPDALPTLMIMVVLSAFPCLGWAGFVLLGASHFQFDTRKSVIVFFAYALLLIPPWFVLDRALG